MLSSLATHQGPEIGSGPEFCNLAFSQAGEVKVVAYGAGGVHAQPGCDP